VRLSGCRPVVPRAAQRAGVSLRSTYPGCTAPVTSRRRRGRPCAGITGRSERFRAEKTAPGIGDAGGGFDGAAWRCTLRSGAVGKWLMVAASWGVTTTLAEPIPRCLAPRLCRSVNCTDVQTDAGCTTLLRAAPLPAGNRRPSENAARVRLRKSRGPPRLTAGRTTPLALQQRRRRASVRAAAPSRYPAAHDHGPLPHHQPSRRGTRHEPRPDLHPSFRAVTSVASRSAAEARGAPGTVKARGVPRANLRRDRRLTRHARRRADG